ncbi:MAG: hypothetical protein H7839_09135 [Magnetococcus sp. YQC-5]
MIIEQTQLDILNHQTTDQYAEWFLNGFRDWSSSDDLDDLDQAFAPIQNVLSLFDIPLYEQLAEIYNKLTQTGQKAFTTGLAQAISRCMQRPEGVDTLWQMVYLGVSIEAESIIDNIIPSINKYYLDPSESFDEPTFDTFNRIINVLSYWDHPKLNNYWLWAIHQPSLPSDDASPIFLALCRSHPENFPYYLFLASSHFAKLLKESYFPKYMIREFVTIVNWDVVLRNIPRLRLIDPLRKQPDIWFCRQLQKETKNNENWYGVNMILTGLLTIIELNEPFNIFNYYSTIIRVFFNFTDQFQAVKESRSNMEQAYLFFFNKANIIQKQLYDLFGLNKDFTPIYGIPKLIMNIQP